MKSLFFFRHAKSSWDPEGVPDDQRPLLPKGIKKTGLIVDFLKKRGIHIDLMISSQAVRAFETAKIVAAGLDYPVKKIRKDRRIYDGPYDRVLDLIFGTSNDIDSLMIFGHNPLITQLANLFLSSGIEVMPTSAVICITFQTDKWEEISTSESKQEFFVFPQMLKK
jgi:phosphohistidine phosphatase